MDSGAAVSVAHPSMAPGITIEESPGSKRGQHLLSARKARLPYMGQQRMPIMTNVGMESKVLYQVAEVSKPLTAVSAACDSGNVDVYSSTGGAIHKLSTGARTHFGRKGGIYELDLRIKTEEFNGGVNS